MPSVRKWMTWELASKTLVTKRPMSEKKVLPKVVYLIGKAKQEVRQTKDGFRKVKTGMGSKKEKSVLPVQVSFSQLTI